MKGYVYFIINQVDQKRYVGITTDFRQRISHHLNKLEKNEHPNPKLQNAWNYYGKDNFKIEKITYESIPDRQFLREEEKRFVALYDSYNNGYNCTIGGEQYEGSNSRGKMSYEDYCFAYIGNNAFPGMTTRTAKYLKCDSSTIASIKNQKAYLWYFERLQKEDESFKEEILNRFKEELNIEEQAPWIIQKTLSEKDTLKILCFVSTYGRGAEKICLDLFNLSKGFVFHFVTGTGRTELKEYYKNLTEEEIKEIGHQAAEEWGIKKLPKEQYKNLKDKYPNREF